MLLSAVVFPSIGSRHHGRQSFFHELNFFSKKKENFEHMLQVCCVEPVTTTTAKPMMVKVTEWVYFPASWNEETALTSQRRANYA